MTIKAFRPQVGPSSTRGLDSSHAAFVGSVRASMDAIIREYNRWIDNVDGQAGDVLLEALQAPFDESQEIVPVLTGELKASGYLEKEHFRGKAIVAMGYARGGIPDYAVMVHENPATYHREPTQYKFLQQPLEKHWPEVQVKIIEGFKIAGGML